MSINAISRLVAESSAHNTLNLRTVKLFFHKSPGKPRGDSRGIPSLEFRVIVDGVTTRTMTTDTAGMIEVPLRNGTATLELLHQGTPVSAYEITIDDVPLDPVDKLLGQQQRLRHLGYQLGHAGPAGDGVGAGGPPLDITPVPPRPPDPEEDEDDRELAERRRRERRENPAIRDEHFVDFNFFTERSILDFQAEAGIFIDARVGPITQGKLVEAVGE